MGKDKNPGIESVEKAFDITRSAKASEASAPTKKYKPPSLEEQKADSDREDLEKEQSIRSKRNGIAQTVVRGSASPLRGGD